MACTISMLVLPPLEDAKGEDNRNSTGVVSELRDEKLSLKTNYNARRVMAKFAGLLQPRGDLHGPGASQQMASSVLR